MINPDQVKYGDKIALRLTRPGLPDVTITGTAEEDQPGFLSLAGWRLNDDRITITDHQPQWLEPPDWQAWDALSFDGRRFIRVVLAKVPVLGKVSLGTVWRGVDEDLTPTDAELLALMKGKRVIRLVLSEVWS